MDRTAATTVLRKGGWYKPEIRLEGLDETRVLVKDFAPCGAWFRWVLARWLVARECSAYRAAEGVPGVARLVARLGPYALAVEHVEAEPCTELNGRPLPEDFWGQLAGIVDALHARHIAHGDLKKLENILVTTDDLVVLVDFNSAAYSRWDPVQVVCYPYLVADDKRAVIKAKLTLAPDLVTDEEMVFLNQRPAIERVFRWLRKRIRPVIKALGGHDGTPPQDPPPFRPHTPEWRKRHGQRTT